MNLDFGSDDKITAEVQSRTAKLLHTYENLFNRLKMSGTLDSNMQGYFDNLDDSRTTVIKEHSDSPKFVSVLSGKINTVYDLDEVLLND